MRRDGAIALQSEQQERKCVSKKNQENKPKSKQASKQTNKKTPFSVKLLCRVCIHLAELNLSFESAGWKGFFLLNPSVYISETLVSYGEKNLLFSDKNEREGLHETAL